MSEPLMCATPDDCPNGPGAHPFVAPDLALMCCCRQPWEDHADGLMDANDKLLRALANDEILMRRNDGTPLPG